jgi:cation transport regulator ChaB
MQEELREIKEGRVLSRKNRKIVKDAITALNAVLKADATGSREDEESATGTVTEREIEIEREGEKEFSKEDIAKVVKEVSGEQMGEILKDAFEKALDPDKIKAMVGEGIKLELDKLRGKVT